MTRRIISVLCSWLLTLAAAGQDSATKPFLWEARNGESVVYLMGSVHELRAQDYPLHPLMEDAFQQAAQLVFEINFDEATSAPVVLLAVQKGTYPQPDNLAAHLSKDTYDRVVAYAEANGIRFYDLYRPWFLNQVLTTTELGTAGFDASFGMDKHFFDLAQDRRKPIKALETATFQINLLASLPETNQIASMEQFLDDPARAVSEVVQIVETWKRGDAEGLRNIIETEFQSDPQTFELILTQRNRNWLPAIEGFLKDNQTTLVVVGAAHLVGEEGLVNLLRNRGYDVQQLPRVTVPAPRFKGIERSSEGEVRLTVESEVGRNYTLETSSNLKQWTIALEFLATNSVQVVAKSISLTDASVFFRLRTMQSKNPLTPALSPSDGEREKIGRRYAWSPNRDR